MREPISAVQMLGAVLVLAGVMIVSVKPRAASGGRTPRHRGL